MSIPASRGEPRFALVALLAALTTLSPFATDTYVPALSAVREALGAGVVETQQTLSAYMLGLSLMALWHGAIADALGRRPVLVVGMALYTAGALGCALAQSIEVLILMRFLQGLAGGVGMIVVRAMIRDMLEGAPAQRLLSRVMMMFSIAPAIAPIIGGWLYAWFGWRSIFWFLFGAGFALTTWAFALLPETLPKAKRQSLHPIRLARSYLRVLRSAGFHALTAVSALSFQAFFQYVGAAHPFLVTQLGLSETQFAVLFIPAIAGFMIGSALSGRAAGRWSARRTASVALILLFAGSIFNVAYHAAFAPNLVASIAPIFVAATSYALLAPLTQLMVMDLFPAMRGLAASCQAFAQLLVSTGVIGFASIALSGSTLLLAIGQLAWTIAGFVAWLAFLWSDHAVRRRHIGAGSRGL
jgi:DHA1 family bicyclomycin/chloramphenicol resistance-like MFS transporter